MMNPGEIARKQPRQGERRLPPRVIGGAGTRLAGALQV